MHDLIRTFSERGDLAHLALFLWAASASALLLLALRELSARRGASTISCASSRASMNGMSSKNRRPTLMDNLHNVLRSIRETKARPDHLTVFREFLNHLDRAAKRAKRAPARKAKPAKRRAKN